MCIYIYIYIYIHILERERERKRESERERERTHICYAYGELCKIHTIPVLVKQWLYVWACLGEEQ